MVDWNIRLTVGFMMDIRLYMLVFGSVSVRYFSTLFLLSMVKCTNQLKIRFADRYLRVTMVYATWFWKYSDLQLETHFVDNMSAADLTMLVYCPFNRDLASNMRTVATGCAHVTEWEMENGVVPQIVILWKGQNDDYPLVMWHSLGLC